MILIYFYLIRLIILNKENNEPFKLPAKEPKNVSNAGKC